MQARRRLLALGTERLILLVLLLCIFFMASREVTDPDFWWHLRTGQYICETRSIPREDIFSHTMSSQRWITHEWLTEVILYVVYELAGQEGLIITFAAVITGAFALLYLRCRGRPYVASLVVIWAAITSAVTWGVRPQMVSLLLSSVFLYVLDLYRAGRTKYIWLMPPLMILWANLHGSFLLGLAFALAHAAGSTVANLFNGGDGRDLAWREIRLLLIVTLISGAVTILNPNGLQLLLYPFETLGSPAMQAYITEWFSPDFHQIQFQPLALFIILTMVALALAGHAPSPTDLLLLVTFGYAALRSARNIPFFVLTATPVLCTELLIICESRQWTEHFVRGRERRSPARLVVNWLLLSLVVVGGAIKVGLVLRDNAEIQRRTFPVDAVDFIVDEGITGNMYNLYHWGGYLVWRLYPQHKVFIDGRADVYGDDFIDEYLQVYQLREGWRKPLDRYDVRLVIVDEASALSTVLNESPDWERRYADEKATIFVRQEEDVS